MIHLARDHGVRDPLVDALDDPEGPTVARIRALGRIVLLLASSNRSPSDATDRAPRPTHCRLTRETLSDRSSGSSDASVHCPQIAEDFQRKRLAHPPLRPACVAGAGGAVQADSPDDRWTDPLRRARCGHRARDEGTSSPLEDHRNVHCRGLLTDFGPISGRDSDSACLTPSTWGLPDFVKLVAEPLLPMGREAKGVDDHAHVPANRPGYELEFEDPFTGGVLDPNHWVLHYLPQWSTRGRSTARYELTGDCLRLLIEADQPPWCPEFDGSVRVSSLQTGVFAGPVGSTSGQHRFHPELTVREEQQNVRLYTPMYGLIEMGAKVLDDPRNMGRFG